VFVLQASSIRDALEIARKDLIFMSLVLDGAKVGGLSGIL
jgi:hypothetical protein